MKLVPLFFLITLTSCIGRDKHGPEKVMREFYELMAAGDCEAASQLLTRPSWVDSYCHTTETQCGEQTVIDIINIRCEGNNNEAKCCVCEERPERIKWGFLWKLKLRNNKWRISDFIFYGFDNAAYDMICDCQ